METRSPGIDESAVTKWVVREIDTADAPLGFDLITGGRSNLTYRVTDGGGRCWVLRRPPAGPVLPSAHDVTREARVLQVLQRTPVPVPTVVAVCADPAVTGAEFYVMDHVEGIVLDSEADAAQLSPTARRAAAGSLVDTLAAIHDVDCAPLEGLRRPGSYVERQLRRWMRQFERSSSRCVPVIGEVHKLLSARVPTERWTGLVHGDYRPGNAIFGGDGHVRAVLDWELCTVGDTLADIGWLTATWQVPDAVGWAPADDSGFGDAADLADRYAQRTGRDLSDLGFYQAFALWRLACIAEGVHSRYAAGSMGEQDVDLDQLARRPAALALAAREALRL
ncbi:phosphotransferase family protein [Rhodococcus opacus]|uniref:phosphotransferase family protein n=1 Tax=Rhodococcus opacus TaxID=37919 RepID=UPI001C493850|nr:phosphotransferase family protein [Rhodococcus opacus]MBV6754889.1 phosphotransferase family protein [Rhodococcus opacus]